MVYSSYSFKSVFQYQHNDIYWCTADIGWITGHSYIVYGPLLNGATTIMFEGVPSYPDFGRFWEICEKHKVNQFYTAPTAIRALAKHSLDFVRKYDLSSLKVLGTVGEPINEEAWKWYNQNIGKNKAKHEKLTVSGNTQPKVVPKLSISTLGFFKEIHQYTREVISVQNLHRKNP